MIQIGIDIGHGRLKVVGVRRLFGRTSLVGAATVGIPTEVFTQTGLSSVKELTEAIGVALQEAHPHALRSREVVSALPANLVLTKHLELPLMSRAELAQTITFEATQAFPLPPEELVIDWQVLREVRHDGKLTQPTAEGEPGVAAATPHARQEVLLVGAPKGLVTALVELFENLNLNLLGLEIKPLANVRATTESSDRGTILLIDIGDQDTSLVVVEGSDIRHIATLKFGAHALIRQTTPTANATLIQTPDKSAKTTGQTSKRTNPKKPPRAPTEPVSLDFLASQLRPLVTEIDHVVKFAEHRLTGAGKIRRLRLCGGGANVPRLATLLSHETGIPTELANPLRHLQASANLTPEAALPLTTAIGLSLRESHHD